jgi:hypothetical protein
MLWLFASIFVLTVLVLGSAGILSAAHADPRLGIALSGVLFSLGFWTAAYSYRMSNIHFAGFEGLRYGFASFGAGIVAMVAVASGLMLIAGVLSSSARLAAPLALLPVVVKSLGESRPKK